MLLRFCLIHITIIIPKHSIHLYLCPCLGLGLLILHLCDLYFILSLIFIVINHITLFKQTQLFCCTFFRISSIIFGWWRDEESQQFSIIQSSASECCLTFAWFFANFSLVLLIKVFLIKKRGIFENIVSKIAICDNYIYMHVSKVNEYIQKKKKTLLS